MVWEGELLVVHEKFILRLKRIFILMLTGLIVIAFRFFYIQVIKGEYFYKLSEQNRTQLFLERAPRGIIYDVNGKVICENKPNVSVLFYPFLSKNNPEVLNDLIIKLEKILPDVRQKIIEGYNSRKTVCLARNISRELMFKLLEQKMDLQVVSVVTEMSRFYPYKDICSHIIGYISEIDSDELKELQYLGYRQGDIIGKSGIEKQYDGFLRGEDGGWLIETDARGRQTNVTQRILPVPGKNIYLTIDIELQKIADECLKQTGCAGAIVGLDPKDGAVRILAVSPGFDPNLFVYGDPERLKYFSEKSLPLFNRAIQGEYAPGSVFKIITAISVLNEKKITPNDKFFCPGYFTLGRKTFKCWEEKGHKSMDLFSGITNSCDVYFYNVGLKSGIENIISYAEKFNLGKKLGIDLPSERSGFLPVTSWRKSKFKYWADGDTVNIAIGQGYLTVTPLQLASLISTVANKGTIYRPYLVSKISSQDGIII
ncbi:MAG: penicillin-binding protein 2, partial [Endomicrobiia bacterium]